MRLERRVGKAHGSSPHIDLYLSHIPRERIVRRTGLGQAAQFTPALTLMPEISCYILHSRGPWQMNYDTTESHSAENEVSGNSFSYYKGLVKEM